LKITSV
jgi:hypothetical protein